MVHFIDVEGLTLNLSNFTEEAPISFHSIPGTTMGVAIDETSDTAYAYQAQKTQTGSRSATLKGDTLFIKPMNADNKAMKYQSDYANLPPHPGWVNNPSVHYKTETIQGPNRTDMIKQEHIELGRILKARKGHKRTGQTSYFTGNPQNILGRSQVSYCQVDSEAVVDDCELMHVRGVVTESFLQRSKVSYASLGYSALNSSNVNYGGVMHSALIASTIAYSQVSHSMLNGVKDFCYNTVQDSWLEKTARIEYTKIYCSTVCCGKTLTHNRVTSQVLCGKGCHLHSNTVPGGPPGQRFTTREIPVTDTPKRLITVQSSWRQGQPNHTTDSNNIQWENEHFAGYSASNRFSASSGQNSKKAKDVQFVPFDQLSEAGSSTVGVLTPSTLTEMDDDEALEMDDDEEHDFLHLNVPAEYGASIEEPRSSDNSARFGNEASSEVPSTGRQQRKYHMTVEDGSDTD